MAEKTENIKIRVTEQEKEKITEICQNMNETISENILRSLELRNELIEYIENNNLDDENIEQYKDLILIIIKNLKIID